MKKLYIENIDKLIDSLNYYKDFIDKRTDDELLSNKLSILNVIDTDIVLLNTKIKPK